MNYKSLIGAYMSTAVGLLAGTPAFGSNPSEKPSCISEIPYDIQHKALKIAEEKRERKKQKRLAQRKDT